MPACYIPSRNHRRQSGCRRGTQEAEKAVEITAKFIGLTAFDMPDVIESDLVKQDNEFHELV
jgi:hypothetical protein